MIAKSGTHARIALLIKRRNHLKKWSIAHGGLTIALIVLAGCETGQMHEHAMAVEEPTLTSTSISPPRLDSGGERRDAEATGTRRSAPGETFTVVLGRGDTAIRLRCTTPVLEYPAAARALELEGTATVRIVMNATGQVERTTLVKSSGHERLDVTALSTLHRMQCDVKSSGGLVEKGFIFSRAITFTLR